ncbi:unnamed protein product [Urochloa humidicola]
MERRSPSSSGLEAKMAVLSSWLLLLLQAGSGVGVLGDASFGCPSGSLWVLPQLCRWWQGGDFDAPFVGVSVSWL